MGGGYMHVAFAQQNTFSLTKNRNRMTATGGEKRDAEEEINGGIEVKSGKKLIGMMG